MKESALQRKCLGWVKKYYQGKLLAVNIHGGGYTNKGFPDLLVFGFGRVLAVELKADSGYQLQTDQILWRDRLLAVGIPHYVIKDLDTFKQTIQEEFNESKVREQAVY